MKIHFCLALSVLIFFANQLFAQAPEIKHHILIDIAHGQKFWNDPARMDGMDANLIERIKYMTGEIKKSAASVGADVGYLSGKIERDLLDKCDILFIHIPSSKYSAEEIAAIHQYLRKGGALFLVMDADYWSTLEQVNANDIVSQYGIKYGQNSPDSLSGGYTKAGPITPKPLKITYHGARTVTGGTPFCFSNQSEENPFGTFTELQNGGKIVAMGDGMVSLYMTSWKDVNDYQCSEFMHDVFAWLLK
jgi:hypothetical protein